MATGRRDPAASRRSFLNVTVQVKDDGASREPVHESPKRRPAPMKMNDVKILRAQISQQPQGAANITRGMLPRYDIGWNSLRGKFVNQRAGIAHETSRQFEFLAWDELEQPGDDRGNACSL